MSFLPQYKKQLKAIYAPMTEYFQVGRLDLGLKQYDRDKVTLSLCVDPTFKQHVFMQWGLGVGSGPHYALAGNLNGMRTPFSKLFTQKPHA